jgi:hypothetical protein
MPGLGEGEWLRGAEVQVRSFEGGYFGEEKEKSSHYGLNTLGYTCATKVKTMRCDEEI